MKRTFFPTVFAILAGVMLASTTVMAQSSPPRFPPGGFDRPLSSDTLRGNPGGTPKLTIAEFKALLAHWADYDANKNKRLDKSEVPELFATLFGESDVNHDGVIDNKERSRVTGETVEPTVSVRGQARSKENQSRKVQNSGPANVPVSRLLFGDPVFGGPPIPDAAK